MNISADLHEAFNKIQDSFMIELFSNTVSNRRKQPQPNKEYLKKSYIDHPI